MLDGVCSLAAALPWRQINSIIKGRASETAKNGPKEGHICKGTSIYSQNVIPQNKRQSSYPALYGGYLI